MKAGKLGLAMMLACISATSAQEIDVQLFVRPSNLLISRQAGEIIEVLPERGAQVQQGDILLSVRDGRHVSYVRATSGGEIQLDAKKVVVGASIQQGDILAEVISNDIKGEFRIYGEQASGQPLELNSIYCCLSVAGKAFEIQVEDAFLDINSQLYHFSVIAPGPELFDFLSKGTREPTELVMRLSVDNSGRG